MGFSNHSEKLHLIIVNTQILSLHTKVVWRAVEFVMLDDDKIVIFIIYWLLSYSKANLLSKPLNILCITSHLCIPFMIHDDFNLNVIDSLSSSQQIVDRHLLHFLNVIYCTE